jgi:hypothetical protein
MPSLQPVRSSVRLSIAFFMNSIWPKARILLIILIAVSMAEFVALDAGMMVAADILLYMEAIIGAWVLTVVARFVPGLSTILMLFAGRIFDFGNHTDNTELEEVDRLK